jgi:hypothetical protein
MTERETSDLKYRDMERVVISGSRQDAKDAASPFVFVTLYHRGNTFVTFGHSGNITHRAPAAALLGSNQ